MFAVVPVSDTISEIMDMMSPLSGHDFSFGHYITKNITSHLSSIKSDCRKKLDLSDPNTREWAEQVIDLFYLVDDLCAEVALLQKQRIVVMAACKCHLTWLLQLKQIEKQVLRLKASVKNAIMLPNRDVAGDGRYYYKEIIHERSSGKEEGVVRAVVTFTVTDKKATHAKDACQDVEVKSEFGVVLCIAGRELQQQNYAKSVIDELEKKRKDESTKGKGFLVVLDHIENDVDREEWLKLAEKLKKVAATSCETGVLLVTTMRLSVARLVGHSFEPAMFRFDWLSPSETLTWSVFEGIVRAIESFSYIPQGSEIIATVVMSRKLSSESDVNQLKDEIVQEMWLKYCTDFHLSNLRRRLCFAYSLFMFSAQYYVKPEMLVRHWMAQGFLKNSSSTELEDSGHEFINEPSSPFIKYYDGDLGVLWPMRALARVLLGNDGCGVSWDEDNKGTINNNHVSLSSKLDVLKGIPKSFFRTNKNVRTFLLEETQTDPPRSSNQVMLSWFACDSIFSAFKTLRLLTLKRLGMKALPESIGDLKSLRYLDLSHNNFIILAISIGELRYLQTLLLSHCLKLKELPNDVNHFASLRHLEVDNCPDLLHMPSALKRLTWLRSLPHFVASSSNGVGGLLNLNDIRGDLTISHLERVIFKGSHSHSSHNYLKEKQHLERLTLRWNHDDDDGVNNQSCEEEEDHQNELMLQHLEPHQNLKRLSIIGYRGNQFADWLSSLNNLVDISLYYCPKCQSLPTLDLAKLEKLTLVSLDSLHFIIDKYSEKLSLKQVKISDCPNLTSWYKSGAHNTVFTAVSELVVEYCPKLVSMPLFPDLENKLVLDSSNMEPLLNTLRHKSDSSPPLSKLKHFTIINMDEKQYPREQELLNNFTNLETLDIRNCKALKHIKGWKQLSSLESLHISNCTDIDIQSEEWKGLETVTELVIKNMSDLKSLSGLEHLTNLEILEIRNCSELTALPENFNLSRFSTIFIGDCPELASLPKSFEEVYRVEILNCPKLEVWKKSKTKISIPRSGHQLRSMSG